MNKTELIDAISQDTGLTRRQSETAVDALVYEITKGVWEGVPVRITGFGTFKLRERAARKGRNPQTGAAVKIKASKGIGFTPGLGLKADLNARRAPQKPVVAGAAPTAKAPAKSAPGKAAPAVKKAAAKKAQPAAAKSAAAKKVVSSKTASAAKKVVTKKAAAAAKKAPAKKATAK